MRAIHDDVVDLHHAPKQVHHQSFAAWQASYGWFVV
jgi:hypothetical protein